MIGWIAAGVLFLVGIGLSVGLDHLLASRTDPETPGEFALVRVAPHTGLAVVLTVVLSLWRPEPAPAPEPVPEEPAEPEARPGSDRPFGSLLVELRRVDDLGHRYAYDQRVAAACARGPGPYARMLCELEIRSEPPRYATAQTASIPLEEIDATPAPRPATPAADQGSAEGGPTAALALLGALGGILLGSWFFGGWALGSVAPALLSRRS